MKIRAKVNNEPGKNEVRLETNGKTHSLKIEPKPDGAGSSVNGGELLLLALATCYCNDLYREAAKLEIHVSSVEVEVEAEFGKEGEPASNVTYRARVRGAEDQERLQDLMKVTDRMAEIQNTLRACVPVTLEQLEAEAE